MATLEARICPNCGYEYEPWVEVCPDCGSLIETRAPEPEPAASGLTEGEDPEWTVVLNVPNAILGTFLKGQLEDEGIPVLMFRANSADIAQFSHYDYVPYDLRVPRHMVQRARRLLDSAPGDNYGAFADNSYGSDFASAAADDTDSIDDLDVEEVGEPSSGEWTLLPTEADVRSRQQVMRSHGESLKGWYWSDTTEPQQSLWPERDEYAVEEEDPYRRARGRAEDEYEREVEGAGWYAPPEWIRIIYGILLLALSLPFILNLLSSIWSGFTR